MTTYYQPSDIEELLRILKRPRRAVREPELRFRLDGRKAHSRGILETEFDICTGRPAINEKLKDGSKGRIAKSKYL